LHDDNLTNYFPLEIVPVGNRGTQIELTYGIHSDGKKGRNILTSNNILKLADNNKGIDRLLHTHHQDANYIRPYPTKATTRWDPEDPKDAKVSKSLVSFNGGNETPQ
jgi:hypothetical protein